MYKTGGEEMVLCPYNRHHVVKKLRIQKHILKCKKNYPEMNLATCVYNYSHRIKPELLLEHYEICSHKIRLDGARYCEPRDFTSACSSVKTEQHYADFPDLAVKARILPEPSASDIQQIWSSSSDSESNDSQIKNDAESEVSDHLDEDDLEPLPLPKTVSKAFVCIKQEPKKSEPSVIQQPKSFGRGKNFLLYSSPKPSRTTDHLLPDLSSIKYNSVKRDKPSWFFKKNTPSICSQSSILDDITTLESLDISSIDEDMIDDSFVLKDFDKYIKI